MLSLLAVQRSLRARFDEFRLATQRENPTAAEIALADFETHFERWTKAEENALIPALERVGIEGRDVRREIRLEHVQIRELAHFILLQIVKHVRLDDLLGYIENLDRRLRAHEGEMERVYYPAAEQALNAEEWAILDSAKPGN